MSYNHENYYALRREFEEKHLRAIERADTLKKELWDRISGLREIDEALSGTGARIMGAALGGKEGMEARIAKVRRDVEALREARALLLEQNRVPRGLYRRALRMRNLPGHRIYGHENVRLLPPCAYPARLRDLRGRQAPSAGRRSTRFRSAIIKTIRRRSRA